MTARAWPPRVRGLARVALALLTCTASAGAAVPSTAVQDEQQPPPGVLLSAAEIALALELSPLPAVPTDPTNAWADDPGAALLGQALFYDSRLSGTGDVACVNCHQPRLAFTDGRPLARGVADVSRHAMTIWNVAHQRWFFWDGRKDSLWSQALAPLEDPAEHASSRLQVVHVLADDPEYAAAYERIFGPLPPLADGARFPAQGRPVPDQPDHPHAQAWSTMSEADQQSVDQVFVRMGKALAAYERRIVSGPAPFDEFVEALRAGDTESASLFPAAAQRGFGLFVGKGQCLTCHDSPLFSDLEFHSNRMGSGAVADAGRATGIPLLLADPFNGASPHADDGGVRARTRLNLARRDFHIPGDFKTPSLRNVASTAPYMHDGRFSTLAEVVQFYSTLEGSAPMHPGGEAIVQARHFSPDEQADLVAFLESLTATELPAELLGPPGRLDPDR